MRHYELVVVLSPMLNPEQVTESWDRIKGFITTREAEISHEEQWGTRRLAYPIRKGQHQFLEGSYHLTRFATERPFNRELETFLKVDDEVIRSMVTVTLPEEELAAQAAAAARAIRTPPPRPAPVGPDGAPVAPTPTEGEAPAVPAEDAPEAATATSEDETPVADAEDSTESPEAAVEEEPPVADAEPGPATEEESESAADDDNASPEIEPEAESTEEPEEPPTEPDESEE